MIRIDDRERSRSKEASSTMPNPTPQRNRSVWIFLKVETSPEACNVSDAAVSRQQHQRQKAVQQMHSRKAASNVGTCCFGFTSERDRTEEKCGSERERTWFSMGGGEQSEWKEKAGQGTESVERTVETRTKDRERGSDDARTETNGEKVEKWE